MRYYELLYIVNPNLEDERVNGIIDEVGKEVAKYKINIINHHIWGKKRLAYPVNNNKYGIYILLQFSAEQFEFLKDFERYLILSKSVIRHQIIKLEEEPKKVDSIKIEDDSETAESEDVDVVDEVSAVDENVETTEETTEEVQEDSNTAEEEVKEESSEAEKKEEGEK